MMTDLRHMGGSRARKAPQNRMKVKKEPVDLRKYLLPLLRTGGKAGLVLLVGGLLAASIHRLLKTTPFPVQKIEVRGVQKLSPEEIVSLSGVRIGEDMLALRLKTVGGQIAASPWVADVRVQRFFPGTLAVSVTERQPVAVVNMGLLYYLDAQGEPFKPLNFGDKLDYPVVSGFTEEDLNSDPDGARDALASACELIEALKQQGVFILADVSEIHYDRGHGFTLYTTSGAVPVRIGMSDFTEKLNRFARIYEHLMTRQQGLLQIDLDYSDKIVITTS
jgi:cell division septal protein FtsQ